MLLKKSLKSEDYTSRMTHNYEDLATPYIDGWTPCNDEMEKLKLQLQHLQRENENLKKKTLCLSSYKDNEVNFHYMTNLPNYNTFEVLAMFLHRRCDGGLNYWRHQQSCNNTRRSIKKPGKERTLNFQEELFLVLVRLKRGMELRDMHLRTGVSVSTLSRIFTTWIDFMNNELTAYFEMVAVDLSHVQTMPCMAPFPEVTITLDCTELFSQRSMDLQVRKETFSNYKHHDTVKLLVGMGPRQAVNFVSAALGGRATDKHITLNSEKLMSNLAPGSSAMADRGFLATEELRSLGVKMIMPHFKGRDRPQFSATEAWRSAQISSARIHIERVIQRIKTFHILENSIRMDQKDMIEQTFRVCSYLVNLQRPILND
ncbi:uncharacterized protein LOC124272594 [Haliotis rubra]|uniref:uncharacterized protein LOC124272594 n=1 Tax=Haliotis rubra TaxID=36100 RepID=UPI001EE5BFAD|nr:uncharacterized protein LOC124272594 [Haliotis rubra]